MSEPFQPALFTDDIYTALTDVVRALGGFKKVGVVLRPEKPADDAGRWLANCLNKAKADKLNYEQILWLLREGRRIGCHTAMHYICSDSGYAPPVAIDPEDEQAELQRQFIESVRFQAKIVERMERLREPTIPITLGDRRKRA